MNPTTPTFRQAADTVMPFGKYAGKTIDQVGTSDAGLLYLDWLRGEGVRQPEIRLAIAAYLDDQAIAASLSKLVRS